MNNENSWIESNPASREWYDFCTKELSEELWDQVMDIRVYLRKNKCTQELSDETWV